VMVMRLLLLFPLVLVFSAAYFVLSLFFPKFLILSSVLWSGLLDRKDISSLQSGFFQIPISLITFTFVITCLFPLRETVARIDDVELERYSPITELN
jgi:fumarate reductase subunit D